MLLTNVRQTGDFPINDTHAALVLSEDTEGQRFSVDVLNERPVFTGNVYQRNGIYRSMRSFAYRLSSSIARLHNDPLVLRTTVIGRTVSSKLPTDTVTYARITSSDFFSHDLKKKCRDIL